MLLTILIAFVSIIGLVSLHELGHFIIAKKFGVKVEEFGIGFPPRIFGKKFGETVYSLNLLPLGAFVKIAGEEGEDKSVESHRSFQGKSFWQKIAIILGGVVSFWLIAIILLTIVFSLGATQAISDDEAGQVVNPKVQILAVAPNSPAEKAGIKQGDSIKDFKFQNLDVQIQKVKEVQELSEKYKGQEVVLTIERGKDVFDVKLTPRVSPPQGEGLMGLALVRTSEKSYPLWVAPVKGISATFEITKAVIDGWVQIVGGLVNGNGMPQGAQLVGPIGIGSMIGQAARAGLSYYLQFIAVLAVYLAVFNILPIPALDGGKTVFIIIEKLKGSPLNPKVEQSLTAVFFGLLILLMIFVTIKDLVGIF